MALWIPITLLAAFAQNLRFMLQKHLKDTSLSSGGATLSRFLYSFPLAAVLVLSYASLTDQALPETSLRFWAFALAGAVSQIIATMCVVSIFQHRNFAIGITFKKTAVIQAAIVGVAFFGDAVSFAGWGAILIGLVGVLLLSRSPNMDTGLWQSLKSRATLLGLASGLLFAISGTTYRAASLEIASEDPFLRAAVTLVCVTASQFAAMGLWLRWKEPGQVTAVWQARRVAVWVGLTSMAGSLGWFIAFTLQTAAYVKAVGQIELIFSIMASVLFFKEKITARELMGIGFLAASILAFVLLV